MAGEIVAVYENGEYDSVRLTPAHELREHPEVVCDYSSGQRHVIAIQPMKLGSGLRLYRFSPEQMPADQPATAIPDSLLQATAPSEIIGPGGVCDAQDIVRKSGRAAKLIILHYVS